MITVIDGREKIKISWRENMTVEELIKLSGREDCVVVRIKTGKDNYKYFSKPNFETAAVPDNAEVYLMPLIVGG